MRHLNRRANAMPYFASKSRYQYCLISVPHRFVSRETINKNFACIHRSLSFLPCWQFLNMHQPKHRFPMHLDTVHPKFLHYTHFLTAKYSEQLDTSILNMLLLISNASVLTTRSFGKKKSPRSLFLIFNKIYRNVMIFEVIIIFA